MDSHSLAVEVPNGEYPCRLQAEVDDVPAFGASMVLKIQCNVAADQRTWGALKDIYRP